MKWPRGRAGRESGRTEPGPAFRLISSGAAPKYRGPLAMAGVTVNAEQRPTTPLDKQPRRLMNTTL
jgi:hypothetical protein